MMHFRTIDSLEWMLRAGTVDDEMFSGVRGSQAQLRVHGGTREKWRQRGRVSHTTRLPIVEAAKLEGIEVDLAAFDRLGPNHMKSETA